MSTYNRTRPVADNKTQVLSFVKDKGIWYADLPEFLALGLGVRENLMMVDGADTFLDLLAEDQHHITLQISAVPFPQFQCRMQKTQHGLNATLLDLTGHAPVAYGAYYLVDELHSLPYNHSLWLCPVTEYVFGSYPDTIYVSIIN